RRPRPQNHPPRPLAARRHRRALIDDPLHPHHPLLARGALLRPVRHRAPRQRHRRLLARHAAAARDVPRAAHGAQRLQVRA
ncbi:hypothetical protein LTR16_012460, partial [Cryomyces antarcticus]